MFQNPSAAVSGVEVLLMPWRRRFNGWRTRVAQVSLAIAAVFLASEVPAAAETLLDVRPPRSVNLDGKPERFLVCDQPGAASVTAVSIGRFVVPIAAALNGSVTELDPRRCEPPPSVRPSVQCSLGRTSGAVHVDVRLTGRTRKIGHGIFGERWEYRSLRLRRLTGEEFISWSDHEIELPADEWFEDRVVRHLGGAGQPPTDSCGAGFLVIRSHVQQGAALALFSLSQTLDLQSHSVSERLGEPGRWRDVIGVADVVGDGKLRVVEVIDPHRIGQLRLDVVRDGRIEPGAVLDGYTTHRFGRARHGIGALLDLTGDGVADIVVPTSDWKCLAVVTAGRGILREVGRLSCGAATIVDALANDIDGDGKDDVIVARDNGTIEIWTR